MMEGPAKRPPSRGQPEAVYIGMTIAAPMETSAQSGIWISFPGEEVRQFDVPNHGPNQIWLSVFDRWTLDQVFTYSSTDTSQVPEGIQAYDTDRYLLVAASFALRSDNLPQGMLQYYLSQNGAGYQMNQIEQIVGHMGCGEISRIAYILFSYLGTGQPGIETTAIDQSSPQGAILATGFVAATVDGVRTFVPVGLPA
jgi:hypothetical protein